MPSLISVSIELDQWRRTWSLSFEGVDVSNDKLIAGGALWGGKSA